MVLLYRAFLASTTLGLVWLTYRSYVDKRHTKFVVSLPLNAAQGATVQRPWAETKGTLPKVPMLSHPPLLDDRRMR